jgi:outer membrane protein TolC
MADQMKALLRKLRLFVLTLVVLQQCQTYAQPAAPRSGLTLLDAIESTLDHHPLINSQRAQVQISRGLLLQASGVFDSSITSGFSGNKASIPLTGLQQQQDSSLGINSVDQLTNNVNYGIGVQRLFRNGISISPQFQQTRTTDNLFEVGGVNSSVLNIGVIFPLMRGRGRMAVAAQELAAKTEVGASLLDFNQLISQLMANTAADYWNLVAAQKNLAIATENEDRGKTYLSNVQTLVDADHVPRNDLHEVVANLAQRSSTRMAAEQQVLVAQQQLAFDMGTGADHIVAYLPLPADDFPNAEHQELPGDTASCMDYYADEALRRRPDYLASQARYTENKTLLNGARNRLLPQIDLNFAAGYSGLQEGRQFSSFLSSSYLGVPGPNVTAGITYTFPAGNQSARGSVMQSEGLVTQAEMQSQQLARSINSSVMVALNALRNAILRAKTARQSVESFQSALAGEREKYAGGIGSIVNILQIEDRLTSAQSDQVQSELAYALALTQFRFATGTLVRSDQPQQKVAEDTFLTLPFSCGH